MTLTLKVGKRYVRRDGEITGALVKSPYDNAEIYPFLDPSRNFIYTSIGKYHHSIASPADLISEHKPAKPEWRVVIKCKSKAEAQRIAAACPTSKATVERSS